MATKKSLNCALINIQSVTSKTLEIRELIAEKSLDILALTETWLSNNDSSKIAELVSDTHIFYHVPREGRGGGVGLCLSKRFTHVKMIKSLNYTSFEYIHINFSLTNKLYKIIVLYRPPPKSNFNNFINEFNGLMSSLFDENRKVYVCGDFNIWAEDDTDNYTKRFLEVVGNFNYKNVVCGPTARSGHILDLVMCDELDDDLVEVYVDPDYMAQNFHKLENFRIKTNTENKIVKKITFRRKILFDEDILIEHGLQNIEIRKLLNCQCQGENCEERLINKNCVHCLTLIYNTMFKEEYENMCPLITKNIIVKEKCPWFNGDVASARKRRRAAEKKWKRRKTSENWVSYKSERNNVNYLIKRTKIDYYKRKIHEAGTDVAKIYFLLNTLIGGKNKKLLPENVSDARLANNFSAFFENKITDISAHLESNNEAVSHLPDIPYCKFDKFKEVMLPDTKDIVSKAKKSHCERDPFPIGDIKEQRNIDRLTGVIHRITNLSLENGSFPKTEKEASVKSTLKSGKDQQNVESYRPISNLSFLGKTIETAAKKQLIAHMETLNVLPEEQSAYREFHSTETALCSIVSDLLEYIDNGKCAILILLDLSAAFDTVDHKLLIDDLMYIGVEGVALNWFKSYLENRSYHVIINETRSERRTLQRGVPQGNVLGPVLFSIYTIELA